MKILLEHYGKQYMVEISDDVDITEVTEAFKSLCYCMGFQHDTIQRIWDPCESCELREESDHE